MDKTPTYQLSEYGRTLTWDSWRFLGGCELPNSTGVFRTLKPMSFWGKTMTLGHIEDACLFTGRSLARFAVQNLDMPDLAKPYESHNPTLHRTPETSRKIWSSG